MRRLLGVPWKGPAAVLLAGAMALLAAAPSRASSADRQLKAAQKFLRRGKYAAAEKLLLQAKKIDRSEPEVYKNLFFVHVTSRKLTAAREDLRNAVVNAKKRASRFKTGRARKLWRRYLADLYSLNVELTILENEKELAPALEKGGAKTKARAKAFQSALGRVRGAYRETLDYGSFISSLDDPIIDKTLNYMLERPATPGRPRTKGRGKKSKPRKIKAEEQGG